MVKAKPDGYPTVSTSLVVNGASELIDFISGVFGAKERMRMPAADGRVMHAELELGDSLFMVGDSVPMQYDPVKSWVHVYVDDVDGTFKKALDAGAKSVEEPTNMFYGDRTATFTDRWDTRWSIATHVEDVSDEEVAKRMEQFQQQS